MDTISHNKKQKKLRDNVETSVERELRMIEQTESRERLPGEKEQLREKWEQGASRIDSSGKLAEVWNPKETTGTEKRPEFGYFSGVTIRNGKIVR